MLQAAFRFSVVLAAFLAASSCTIALSPSGDPAIVAGLNATNEQAQTLFAAVGAGSPQSAYPIYAPRYDELIGKYEALRMRADARDVPPLGLKLALRLPALSEFADCQDDPVACVNSSPAALENLIDGLQTMKARHANSGVPVDLVAIFKSEHDIYFDQALSIEDLLAN